MQSMTEAQSIQTEWYVVTGAPASGKTTVLDALAAKGIEIIPEVARIYIDDLLDQGKTLDDIRGNEVEFHLEIVKRKLDLELNLPKDKTLFFDRALPDCLAYHRLNRLDPEDIREQCTLYQYKKVFVLDRLDYQIDHVRTEDEDMACYLDEHLERDYREHGYHVVRVPVMSVEERVEFILAEAL